jgi:hypothetical protein
MMPTKQQAQSPPHPEKHENQQRHAVIADHVLNTLGRPGDLHKVEVRPLWDDHYRVNVLVGVDAAAVRVSHSYFLVANRDGTITASTPKITRQY